MKINGDTIVGLLGLSEDNHEVKEMMKELNAPKPLLDDFFIEYGGTSIPLEDYKIELFFADESTFDGTDTGVYGNADLIFSGIDFKTNPKYIISLPFNLSFEDSIDDVYDKIGRAEDYINQNYPQKIWEFRLKNDKRLLLYIMFNSGKYQNIFSVGIHLYSPEHDEVLEDMKVKK